MIDVSRGISRKQCTSQVEVAQDVAARIAPGSARVGDVMIESHLNEARCAERQRRPSLRSSSGGPDGVDGMC
jgi:phospho-2-dehydro-3-deoxyheptonate aldolase